jgi:hypothetical protein
VTSPARMLRSNFRDPYRVHDFLCARHAPIVRCLSHLQEANAYAAIRVLGLLKES